MPRFIPVSPMLQKMAPGVAGQPTPNLPLDLLGPEPGVALPGMNVPVPEPAQIRNRPLPPPMPPAMTDALPVSQQLLDFSDELRETNPMSPTPFDPGYEGTYGRPMDLFEQQGITETDAEFASYAPQVDSIFGLGQLKRNIQRNTQTQSPFAQSRGY